MSLAIRPKALRDFIAPTIRERRGSIWRSAIRASATDKAHISSGVWVDSQNPDILYTVSTFVSQSLDGGKTFNVYKGAPGGEDPHDIWIDPTNGHRMLFGFDQGPAVTLDNGQTWSGYYQIPIAQLYKVATDTRYPYWVMGSQQDTGAVMTRSRGDLGQITNLDWYPLQSSEFGTAVPDPLKPTTIYGVGYGLGQGNGMTKIDIETGQWGNVAPNFGTDRDLYAEGRDFWKRFDTAFEPKAMYAGYNCILVTRDGAETWKTFSPDLTTPKGQPMIPCGVAPDTSSGGSDSAKRLRRPHTDAAVTYADRLPRPLTISDFSISTVKKGVVWSGSSNGQIYNTMDGGKTWNNVTNFTDLPPNANFVTVEAGHNDVNTAYVVANIGPLAVRQLRHPRNITFIERTTAAKPGRASSAACRLMNGQAVRFTSSAKTPNKKDCFLPAPRPPSMFRSTTATIGSRCGKIFPARQSAIWCFTPMTI